MIKAKQKGKQTNIFSSYQPIDYELGTFYDVNKKSVAMKSWLCNELFFVQRKL